MRRSVGVLLAALAGAACTESAALSESPRAPSPVPDPASDVKAPPLPSLAPAPRSGRPSEPVRILEPAAGAELEPATAKALVVAVAGPSGASLVLSLDGARPRRVSDRSLAAETLLDPGTTLGVGAHDLVLAAVDADGVALEPDAGGIASVRFFVGPRRAGAPPRVVCLSPFGTIYGKTPRVVLDVVIVGGSPADAVVTLESAGVFQKLRASGAGPFALGAVPAGDTELSIALTGGAQAAPGRCGFAYNPELERPR